MGPAAGPGALSEHPSQMGAVPDKELREGAWARSPTPSEGAVSPSVTGGPIAGIAATIPRTVLHRSPGQRP